MVLIIKAYLNKIFIQKKQKIMAKPTPFKPLLIKTDGQEQQINTLGEFIHYFAQVCHEIADLADEIGEAGWASRFFRPAYMVLSDDDLPTTRRLEIAIDKTHVFGGMGSWLDSPPFSAHYHGKNEAYDRLTDRLYCCRQHAIYLL
jgi:hypothetical protein